MDIHLNPKIGRRWMRKGHQAEVVTPGDNEKGYLAGSLHWRTGKLITTRGAKKDGRCSWRTCTTCGGACAATG